MPDTHPCRLCSSSATEHFYRDARRGYWRCQRCALVFCDASFLLPAEAEKSVYDLHQNDPKDEGYREFLNRVFIPLRACLPKSGLSGLDFGCGPGPTLSVMLEEAGHKVALYDPYYFPDQAVLERSYDFITCTEAIEHFYQPATEWAVLVDRLKPGGVLAIMTQMLLAPERFAGWTYKNDPTHVSFFTRHTFEFLAARDGLDCQFADRDVVLLRKPE